MRDLELGKSWTKSLSLTGKRDPKPVDLPASKVGVGFLEKGKKAVKRVVGGRAKNERAATEGECGGKHEEPRVPDVLGKKFKSTMTRKKRVKGGRGRPLRAP